MWQPLRVVDALVVQLDDWFDILLGCVQADLASLMDTPRLLVVGRIHWRVSGSCGVTCHGAVCIGLRRQECLGSPWISRWRTVLLDGAG